MIGINPKTWNTLDRGKSFVNRYGLTFTNLWDNTNRVYGHYGSPYTSRYWLLDRNGNRVGASVALFSASRIEQALDELE